MKKKIDNKYVSYPARGNYRGSCLEHFLTGTPPIITPWSFFSFHYFFAAVGWKTPDKEGIVRGKWGEGTCCKKNQIKKISGVDLVIKNKIEADQSCLVLSMNCRKSLSTRYCKILSVRNVFWEMSTQWETHNSQIELRTES